jgi:hypothetical protein
VPLVVSHRHFLEPDNLADMVAGMVDDMVVGVVALVSCFVSEGGQ